MKTFAYILSLAVGSCHAADVGPPIVVGQTFLTASLDPRSGSVPWALVSHGIAEKLYTVDQNDDIVPQIAESLTKVDDDGKIWDVTIKSGYKFSDGTVLDAEHVASSLTELNRDNDNAQASLGAMTVTASGGTVIFVVSFCVCGVLALTSKVQ